MLGLAERAGAVIPGTGRVREAARAGRVRLVLLASDASRNSRDKLEPLLRAAGLPFATVADRARLGVAVGKAPLSAVGITDAALARRIGQLAGVGEPQGEEPDGHRSDEL
jgi:ribosomal protein L7Ae-like RNA K-turn-binding protein